MVRLPINYYPRSFSQVGLTLIEVLIALAIVSIAMTAIIKAVSQNIRSTDYLQNKTTAMWVGQQVLNETRVGLLAVPPPPDKLRQTTTMFNKEWYWQAEQVDTPNTKIKKIAVRVFDKKTEDDNDTPLLEMESYVYQSE